MPRHPSVAAMRRLARAVANHNGATAAAARTKAQLNQAITSAAATGVAVADLARETGTSRQAIYGIIARTQKET